MRRTILIKINAHEVYYNKWRCLELNNTLRNRGILSRTRFVCGHCRMVFLRPKACIKG